MPVEWRVGDRIYGRWTIRQILHGGMGQVYVVYDTELGEVLAAKTFRDGLQARHHRLARYFNREVHTWLHLDAHPHVTRARYVERVEGKPFLFLEHVSGGSLREWIGTERLKADLPRVLRFGVHFCDAMTYVAAKGIAAHRDIKPSNCLITESGLLKVTDFGLATPLPAGGDGAATSPDLHPGAGTWAYMAPERFRRPYTADVRGDVYSFGVMLYAMITGRLPFAAVTREEWAQRHERYAPATVVALTAQPEPLRQVVRTCLAKQPEDRYPDFAGVRQALADLHEQLTDQPLPPLAVGGSLDLTGWIEKGASLAVLGRHAEALACYAQVLATDPGSVSGLTHQGISLAALGHHDQALAAFSRALGQDNHYLAAWVHRGLSLTAQGAAELALTCYRAALDRDPHYAAAWLAQGSTLAVLQRRPEAIAACARAVELNPWLAAAWTQRGRIHLAQGEPRPAQWCAAQALERDPWHPAAWCLKGLAQAAADHHAEATASYGQALAQDQGCVSAWAHRGISLAAQGAHAQALSAYRRALRLEPRCLIAWVNRGRSQAALARLTVALESYDRALELDRRCVTAWLHRAVALARLGRGGEALVSSNRAIRLAPRSAEAWQAKAQVLTEALGRQREAEGCRRRASALGYRLTPGLRLSDEPFPGAPLCCLEPYLRPCNCTGAGSAVVTGEEAGPVAAARSPSASGHAGAAVDGTPP